MLGAHMVEGLTMTDQELFGAVEEGLCCAT